MKTAVDRRIAFLGPLVAATCKRFRLRRPLRVGLLDDDTATRMNIDGIFYHDDRRLEIQGPPGCHMPVVVLAHELAHTRFEGHGPGHHELMAEILDWWCLRQQRALIMALPRAWRAGA